MLKNTEIQKIINFVKSEPKTVQEVSKLIGKSWVTTDTYLEQIKNDTGLINIKVFRKGTQGALKIVYYSQAYTSTGDDLKDELFNQIRNKNKKTDMDFFEIFQYIDNSKKKVFFEESDDKLLSSKHQLIPFLRQAQSTLYIFSGNLSFINSVENNIIIKDVFEELIKRKVLIKILCRVNISSMNNISKISALIKKYPEFIEIKHCFQPLRGFIIDDKIARFKSEENLNEYKPGELQKNMKIYYEIYDSLWVAWLQKVFWNLYRYSIEYSDRIKQLKKFF